MNGTFGIKSREENPFRVKESSNTALFPACYAGLSYLTPLAYRQISSEIRLFLAFSSTSTIPQEFLKSHK
jgi:hypothetical protein